MRRNLPAVIIVAAGLFPGIAVAAGDSVPAPRVDAPALTKQPAPPEEGTGQRSLRLRANVVPGGTSIQAGPTIDYRPSSRHPETPAIAGRTDEAPVELGGFVGFLFRDDAGGPPSSLGFDVQLSTDPQSNGGWLLQPGVDYTAPLSSSLQLNTRLFSTFVPEGGGAGVQGADRALSLRTGSEPGFQDVGVGLGLDYAISDSWNIQTEARYQRMLGAGDAGAQNDPAQHQFFGGVMVDYKF